MSSFVINTDSPKNDFERHLKLNHNHRVIFSGIYGIGKTTFLRNFFGDSEKYNYFHLYPVNYSVSSNEDIFELVKYDIIYQMLEEDYFDFLEPSKLENLNVFVRRNPLELFKLFVSAGSAIGVDLSGSVDKLETVITKFKSQEKKSNKEVAEVLIMNLEKEIGSIREKNFHSHLIKETLQKIGLKDKPEAERKENVLIIDDLDRIDPDHLFRILNVFSAHFDRVANKKLVDNYNKFGFDLVIVVFDIENVRKIFENRYGIDVNFSGYIDKFLSHEVFYFDNKESILGKFNEVVESIKISKNSLCDINSNGSYFKMTSVFLLSCLLHNDLLSTKEIKKVYNLNYYVIEDEKIDIEGNRGGYRLVFLSVLRFLDLVLGGKGLMLDKIKKISEENLISDPIDKDNIGKLEALIPVLHFTSFKGIES